MKNFFRLTASLPGRLFRLTFVAASALAIAFSAYERYANENMDLSLNYAASALALNILAIGVEKLMNVPFPDGILDKLQSDSFMRASMRLNRYGRQRNIITLLPYLALMLVVMGAVYACGTLLDEGRWIEETITATWVLTGLAIIGNIAVMWVVTSRE